MVDVGEKEITRRTATAIAKIKMQPETLDKLLSSSLKKGDGLATARIAGGLAVGIIIVSVIIKEINYSKFKQIYDME